MLEIEKIMAHARDMEASDIHLTEEERVMYRVDGSLIEPQHIASSSVSELICSIIPQEMEEQFQRFIEDLDFAYQAESGERYRVNIFHQRGRKAATIRLLNDYIPSLSQLGLPTILEELICEPRGLILVTGPTGSGKSTTLAAMIDKINEERAEHILTIEDPVEYIYEKKKALIHQREVGRDVKSFAQALRSGLREDPDVILVGEMRDYETIQAALTAAETGHLVLSTLHTSGAAQTIDRMVDAAPPEIQSQMRTQIAGVLKGIITQCLIKRAAGNGRIVATEILIGTDAILNMIRENKCYQLSTIMQSGGAKGMHTLNGDLVRLVSERMIHREDAFRYSSNIKELEQLLF